MNYPHLRKVWGLFHKLSVLRYQSFSSGQKALKALRAEAAPVAEVEMPQTN